MPSQAVIEANEALAAKQKELNDIWDEAGGDRTSAEWRPDLTKIKSLEGDNASKLAKINALGDEASALYDAAQKQIGLDKTLIVGQQVRDYFEKPGQQKGIEHPNGGGIDKANYKSLGQQLIESKAMKEFNLSTGQGPVVTLDIEPKYYLKADFITTAGFPPETTRTGTLILDAQRPIQVIDLFPATTTIQQAVVFMEETTFTNAAAEVSEIATFPEATLILTEQSSPVRKIAVFLPASDEQMEDVPRVQDYVNNRLNFMLMQRVDSQTLVGDGIAPNLEGILNVTGILTQAKGADPTPDAIYKAGRQVRITGRAMPNAVILHPNDWEAIRLLRTADGIYIWGSPSESGPLRIWGWPVVEADAITENTGLIGDFRNFSELATRRGIDLQITNSHGTDFINGRLAIRLDMRVALIIYRPAAFCTITGI